MWRSGITRRRGDTALLEMVQAASRTGSFESPRSATPQVWNFFRSEGEIVAQLQRQWRTARAGEIYETIERGEGDLRNDVTTAFDKVQRKHHGLRKILEVHADHPAIARAMSRERSLLPAFTNNATDGAPQAA